MPPLRTVAAGAALLAYFLYFSLVSLDAGFTHDDLMNMHRAVIEPRARIASECLLFFLPSDQFRPVGALFYRLIHDLFGMRALPYHAAMMVLLAAGLVLLYQFARRLADSREFALLVVLISAHHANRSFFHINAGLCYDALCLVFYYATLVYYLGIRQRGEFPASWQQVRLALLLVAALGSKEMAVSLPVVLVAYEWLAHRRGERSWAFPVFASLAVAAFVYGRVLGTDNIGAIDTYRPHLSPAAYAESARHWLHTLFFRREDASVWPYVAGLLVTAAAAVAGRDRTLTIGLLLLAVGVLPVSFIRPVRGLEAIVIPTTGLAIILAWWLVRLTSISSAVWRAPAVFVLTLAFLLRLHDRMAPPVDVMLAEGKQIGGVLEQITALHPRNVHHARVLFESDPFPLDCCRWATTFMLQIEHGPATVVDRADTFATPPDRRFYDYVYAWEHGRLVRLPPESRQASQQHDIQHE